MGPSEIASFTFALDEQEYDDTNSQNRKIKLRFEHPHEKSMT
jgi:hypothetical protein